MDDQTRLIDDGTAIYPLDPAAAVADETCPHCQAVVPAGDQFCPDCGYQRGTWVTDAAAAPLSTPPAVAARFVLVAADGARYPLPDGQSVAGRSDEADLTIPDGFISRRHARFTVDGDSVSVADLGSANGSFIGEQKLDAAAEHPLAVGITLRLGQTALTLEAVAAESAAADGAATRVLAEPPAPVATGPAPVDDEQAIPGMLAEAQVEVRPAGSPWSLKRLNEDEVFYLPFGASELGRKPDKCDILVRGDGYISGKHARLLASLEHLELIDLGSTNGSYVNNQRAAPDQVLELAAGDTVRLGQTDLTVVYEAVAEDAPDDAAGAAGETAPDSTGPDAPLEV